MPLLDTARLRQAVVSCEKGQTNNFADVVGVWPINGGIQAKTVGWDLVKRGGWLVDPSISSHKLLVHWDYGKTQGGLEQWLVDFRTEPGVRVRGDIASRLGRCQVFIVVVFSICRTLAQTTGFLIEVLERVFTVSVDVLLVTSTSRRAAAHSCAGNMEGAIGREGAVCDHGAVVGALCQDRKLAAHGNHLVRDAGEGAGRVGMDSVVVDSREVGEDAMLNGRRV